MLLWAGGWIGDEIGFGVVTGDGRLIREWPLFSRLRTGPMITDQAAVKNQDDFVSNAIIGGGHAGGASQATFSSWCQINSGAGACHKFRGTCRQPTALSHRMPFAPIYLVMPAQADVSL